MTRDYWYTAQANSPTRPVIVAALTKDGTLFRAWYGDGEWHSAATGEVIPAPWRWQYLPRDCEDRDG